MGGGGGAQTYHCPPNQKSGGGAHAPLAPPPPPASYASDIYIYIYTHTHTYIYLERVTSLDICILYFHVLLLVMKSKLLYNIMHRKQHDTPINTCATFRQRQRDSRVCGQISRYCLADLPTDTQKYRKIYTSDKDTHRNTASIGKKLEYNKTIHFSREQTHRNARRARKTDLNIKKQECIDRTNSHKQILKHTSELNRIKLWLVYT